MKKDKISEIIGSIDDKYINEAISYNAEEKNTRHFIMINRAQLTACLTIVLISVILIMPTISKNKPQTIFPNESSNSVIPENNTEPIPFEELDRHYKNQKMSVSGLEVYYEFPWDKKAVYEQFTAITVDGKIFHSRNREVGEALLGDTIGDYKAEGYDHILMEKHSRTFEIKQINGVSDDLLIAVNMDGKYYVFMNESYAPPASFGELLDGYDLNNTLGFDRFTVYEGYNDMGYYALEDDDFIWQVLADCRNAEFIEDDNWSNEVENKNYIEFTATSEALGIYKKAFYISDDGYLWTNIFDWNYIYNIGENAAEQIISYVTENSTEAEYREAYSNSLIGTVEEIGDGYILVDDSVMCNEESEGMVFKILTDDVKVSRHTEYVEVGDIIMVDFTGKIDVENDNTVTEVYLVTEVFINPKGEWVVNKYAQFMLESEQPKKNNYQLELHENKLTVCSMDEANEMIQNGEDSYRKNGALNVIDNINYAKKLSAQAEKTAPSSNKNQLEMKSYIYHMMLNSVDYFNTAKGSMVYSFGKAEPVKAEFMTNIKEQYACENEFYPDGSIQELHVYDGKEHIINEAYGINDIIYCGEPCGSNISDNNRVVMLDEGELLSIKRKDVTNLAVSGNSCLFPQQYAMSELHDFDNWSITGCEEFIGRKCAVIEGISGENSFKLLIDMNYGFLLKYEEFSADSDIISYTETIELENDIPLDKKMVKLKK